MFYMKANAKLVKHQIVINAKAMIFIVAIPVILAMLCLVEIVKDVGLTIVMTAKEQMLTIVQSVKMDIHYLQVIATRAMLKIVPLVILIIIAIHVMIVILKTMANVNVFVPDIRIPINAIVVKLKKYAPKILRIFHVNIVMPDIKCLKIVRAQNIVTIVVRVVI